MEPLISIIVATDQKRGIGKNGKIPWYIPEDFTWFKKKTTGYPIIMGRKTFESIGKPLPGRLNIVVTHDQGYKPDGATSVHSTEEAIQFAKENNSDEIFVIGGGQIYEQAMPFAQRIYLTEVEGDFGADTFFPDYSEFKKQTVLGEGKSGDYKYKILQLER